MHVPRQRRAAFRPSLRKAWGVESYRERICTFCALEKHEGDDPHPATHVCTGAAGLSRFGCSTHARVAALQGEDVMPLEAWFEEIDQLHLLKDIITRRRIELQDAIDTVMRLKGAVRP